MLSVDQSFRILICLLATRMSGEHNLIAFTINTLLYYIQDVQQFINRTWVEYSKEKQVCLQYAWHECLPSGVTMLYP